MAKLNELYEEFFKKSIRTTKEQHTVLSRSFATSKNSYNLPFPFWQLRTAKPHKL